MSEAQLWNKLRDGLKAAAGDTGIDLERVENMVNVGTPDVNYCYDGAEGWMELKHCDMAPARASTPVFTNGGLRDAQVVWIHKRVKRGGRVWVVARVGDTIFCVHGRHAKRFNQMTFEELKEAADWWHCGKLVEWRLLLDVLVK